MTSKTWADAEQVWKMPKMARMEKYLKDIGAMIHPI
jgi:hypothetical protein